MRKRDITRISYKLNDLKEYEAQKQAKIKDTDKEEQETPKTAMKKSIHKRIGLD